MSSTARAWTVAASMGAVEALKDQGFARWNYTLRSVHQLAKSKLGSASQAKRFSSAAVIDRLIKADEYEKARQSEESLRKVMYLSCWGPN